MNYSMFKTPNSRGFRKSCGSASSTVKSPLQSASSEQDCSSQGGKPPVATVIAAVVEGRGAAKGEVGFGLLDLEPVQLQISQFSDTLTYNRLRIKMQVYRPLVVLMPDSACQRGGDMSMLVELLRDEFAGVAIVPLMRKHFNSDEGLDKINLLRLEESSHLDKDLTNKYYGLACASAVLKYAEMVQNVVLMPHSIKVTCIGAETTCLIDPATSVHLELMMAINKSGKALMGKSLFDVLNRTSTKGGARLLRSNILQPSTDLALIQMRLEAIEALLSNEEAFYTLRSLVGRLVDVDKIIGLCVGVCRSETAKAAEYKITQMIKLKHILELVTPLREILESFKGTFLESCRLKLADSRFASVMELITRVIHEDVRLVKGALNMRLAKCFCVKPGINAFLDLHRRTFNEFSQDVGLICKNVLEEFKLPVKVSFSAVRGFYFSLKGSESSLAGRLPSAFVNPIWTNTSVTFTTRDMMKVNDRLSYVYNEIFLLCNAIVTNLLSEITPFVGVLYILAETMTEIDLIVSLADAAVVGHYIRPMFHGVTVVKNGRHPMLDKLTDVTVVPNDIIVGEEANFVIITGPNMGGKSTYLKQIGLLQIMAQIGSFVPAESATFTICTQIFSRMGQTDDSDCGAFMQEMRDITYIIDQLTSNSLVIIDELGRATAPEEGFALCHAIAEWFITQKANVFFATHFLDLAALDCLYANVENYHFASQTAIINGKRVFVSRHELLKGPYRGPTYGFELIEMSKLPKSLIERAKERSEVSVSQREKSMLKSRAFLMRRAKLRCGRRLRQWLKAIKKLSEVDKPTKEEKRDCLKALRNQYRNEIVDIEEEFGPEDDGNQQQNEENDGQAELGDENQ